MTATFSRFVSRVEASLNRRLPGRAAQALMSPRPPRLWPAGFDPTSVRDAAGLLLVFPVDDRPHLVLTVRAETLERHGGQVSLPGGALDAGETFETAALREAREEIGLDTSRVRALGPLTPIDIHVSGFRLHPIVAAAEIRPSLSPAGGEVARIVEVPIHALQHPGNVFWRTMTRDDREYEVPVFVVEGVEIWGATAMVLSEFLAIIADAAEIEKLYREDTKNTKSL